MWLSVDNLVRKDFRRDYLGNCIFAFFACSTGIRGSGIRGSGLFLYNIIFYIFNSFTQRFVPEYSFDHTKLKLATRQCSDGGGIEQGANELGDWMFRVRCISLKCWSDGFPFTSVAIPFIPVRFCHTLFRRKSCNKAGFANSWIFIAHATRW